MKYNSFDWLPVLFLLVGVGLALRNERHATCENEERYENQVMCAGVQFGHRAPYPDNCGLFLVCDCLYPTVQRCPANLWWNNKTQNCDWPQDTECVYYTIETTTAIHNLTTPTPVSTSTEPNWPTSSWDPPPAPPGIDENFCKNLPHGSVYPYEYDCNAYINCTYGWPVLNYCDHDKVFNAILRICDTPETGNCKPLPLPSTTLKPTTTTEEVGSTTEEVDSTTREPSSTTEEASSTTETENSTTEDASSTTVEPRSTTEEASSTQGEPSSTTVAAPCRPPPSGVDADFCWGKGNGFYEYEYDCNAYIRCHNGCSELEYCMPDKLFNPVWHICDTPNSVICRPSTHPPSTPPDSTLDTTTSSGGSETNTTEIPTTTTTAAATTPALPADVDGNRCKGKPDYDRFPYAGNCSEYLQCKDQEVIVRQCAPTLLFNPDLLICDSADDVICFTDDTTTTSTTIPSPIPTTAPPTTTTERTTLPATTPGPAELCAGKPLGVSYPYVTDCSYYILCLGDDEFYIAPCISNSYFDPKTGQCGVGVSPTACREQATATTTTQATTTTTEVVSTTSPPTTSGPTTTPAPTTSEAPEQPGGICGSQDEGEIIAYPKDCSKYIVCVSPIPVAFYCRPGFFFSAKQQDCVSLAESDCDKDTATTPGHTQPPLEPTICTNSTRDTFPYQQNCQWFIRCVDDYSYMMDVCNRGEYYDPISGKCGADVPPDACRWDYTSTTTTVAPTPPVTRPHPQKGPCDDVADGERVPYPNDCSKYIQCDQSIPAAYECKEGDEFSPEEHQCMEASLANCTVGTTSSPAEPTTPTLPVSSTEKDMTTDSDRPTTPADTPTPQPSTTPQSTTPTEPVTPSPETSSTWDTQPTTQTEPNTSTPEASTTETWNSTEGSPITSPETSPSSTTTLAPPSGICGGKPNGTSIPYPDDCEKYIICLDPIPVGYDCPKGLEFSPEVLECMDPALANCRPRPTTPTTTSPLTTTPETSSEPSTEANSTLSTESTTPESSTPETSSESTTEESSTLSTESTTPETSSESTTVESSTRETSSESTTEESSSPETSSESTTEESSSPETSSESTTEESSTSETSSESTTGESSTLSTESTTPETSSESTTEESSTPETSSESTTEESSTLSTESTTPETSSESTTPESTTIHPDTPNICCGRPLGTILPYPNDCSRYVVCDYPIPYAVVCEEGTLFDSVYLQCRTNSSVTCI